MITDEQRAHFLRELRAGADIKTAAAAAGIHRPRVYTLRDKDPTFARELAEARRAAEPEPELTPFDSENPLSRDQIAAFAKALYKTGSIQRAAQAASVDLFPNRIRPVDLTREQRAAVRDLLATLEPKPEPPPPPEQQALTAWLSGKNWPLRGDDDLDVDELRKLSARAADSLEAWRASVAKVLKKRSRSRPKPDDDGPEF